MRSIECRLLAQKRNPSYADSANGRLKFSQYPVARQLVGGWREPAIVPDRLLECQSLPANLPYSPGCRCPYTNAANIRWYGRGSGTPHRLGGLRAVRVLRQA